jgi:Fe-S-cluster containining protein
MQFPQNVTRLCGNKHFSFRCHPKVPCFTECCRELELVLTPYDVLCLRKELQVSSAQFIARYAIVEQDAAGGFPQVYLGMVDDGRASCPFISKNGCRVYNARPGACRAYPVGRGVTLDENGDVHEIHVLVREEHCQGFSDPPSQNVREWFENQGLVEYNMINDELLPLLQHDKVRRGLSLTQEQIDNFMLILYNLDEFRKVVSAPSSLEGFNLDARQRIHILEDDTSLLRFGVRWLKETLLAEKE